MIREQNNYKDLETVIINDKILRCEDVDEFKEMVLPLIKGQQDEWKRKINSIFEEMNVTKSRFSELCGISRPSLDNWLKGALPKNRETFIRIGMVAGYSLEQMNSLLTRYGQYPALYSKSLEDCVCIFVINHYKGEEALAKYQLIMNRIKDSITRDNLESVDNVTTQKFDAKLLNVDSEDELDEFITDNIAMFSNAYHKLYSYIMVNIEANYIEQLYADNVFAMSEIQGWSSSLKQSVSAIKQGKWYPTRNKIISLGLHLSMDHEQLDEMLQLAHMAPLSAKNIFESVIIYILESASLNDILNTKLDNYDPDELCKYARDVLKLLNLPEIDSFISELPEVDNGL